MMIGLITILSLLVSFLTGYLMLGVFWPEKEDSEWPLVLLRSVTSLGIGWGISSIILFALCVICGKKPSFVMESDLLFLLLCAALFFAAKRKRKTESFRPGPSGDNETRKATWLSQGLFLAFAVICLAEFMASIVYTTANSHGGGWDAWAIWNLHAKFLFRSLIDGQWRDLFSPQLAWSHADYPFLLSALVTRGWIYTQSETTFVSHFMGILFTYALVLAFFSAIAWYRGTALASLSGIILLSTPLLMENGTQQYSDIPLSFFILLSIILCKSADSDHDKNHKILILAGFMAACAAWTKNEGIVFFLLFLCARLGQSIFSGTVGIFLGKELRCVFLGAALPLISLAYFKMTLAPTTDIISGQMLNTFDKLLDPARYIMIIKSILRSLCFSGKLAPYDRILFAMMVLLAGFNRKRQAFLEMSTPILLVGGLMAAYSLVYLITPYDLAWHLANSLDRLISQLFPIALFAVFMTLSDKRIHRILHIEGQEKWLRRSIH